ncbi:MAG TPA: hypothetical protein VL129_01050 [Pseudomonas sp.]|nr:hypothetical protein [Pseudomonas sp.]HTO17722.1 hypothetical protein [Pseudomonas sp.]
MNLLQPAFDDFQFVSGETFLKQAVDGFHLCLQGGKLLSPAVGKPDTLSSTVLGAGAAYHQPGLLHAVNQSGNGRGSQIQLLGKAAHQRTILSLQQEEHAALRGAEAVSVQGDALLQASLAAVQ